MQPHEALFRSLMVTNSLGKRFCSRFKRIKNQLKGRNIPGEVEAFDTLKVTNLGKQIVMNS